LDFALNPACLWYYTSVKLRIAIHKAHGPMSNEAIAKPNITKYSSEFKLDVYAKLPPVEMVVFVVHILQTETAPVAVEEVVSTCFRLFPHSFALKNYFYWPDSALVSRRLHDAKEKGYLKGTTTEGFELKSKGKPVAKRMAKALDVTLPPLPQPEPVPATPAVTAAPIAPAEEKTPTPVAETPKSEPVSEPKTVEIVAPPAAKKQVQKRIVKAKTTAKKAVVKKSPAKKAAAQAIETPKKKPTPNVKPPKQKITRPKPQAVKKPKAAPPRVVKEATTQPKIEKPKNQKVQAEAPKQLALSLTPPSAKEKAVVSPAKPEPKKEAQHLEAKKAPVRVKAPAAAPVAAAISKEEKEKAVKVVRHVDRSDAYQLYKRNGKKAQINEFDFRNLLFATMESPAETLKRNVETFKRYAGIQQRNDLIGFLEFCEQRFAALLQPKAKQPIKKLRF